jgi:hypothetical protein
MEATTYFALFVGLIAVVHFLTLIAERIRPIKRKRNVKTTRQSWYCFFSPNVLLGDNSTEETVIRDDQQDSVRKREVRHQQEKLRLRLKTIERRL